MSKFWPYIQSLGKDRIYYYWGLFFGILFALATGASIPAMLELIVPWVFEESTGIMTGWKLWLTIFAIPCVFLIRGLSGFLNTLLINKGGVKVLENIRLQYYEKLLSVEVGYFNKRGMGDIVSRASADTTIVQQTFTETAVDIVKQPLVLMAAIGYLVYKSVTQIEFSLMLVSLFVVPICVLPVQYFGKRLFKKVQHQQEELGDLSDMITSAVLGSREIRVFNAEKGLIERFKMRLDNFMRTQIKVLAYYHALSPTIEIVTSLGIGVAFLVANYLQIPQGDFLALLAALYFCYEPIKKIGVLSNRIERGRGALERIEAITKYDVAVQEVEKPLTLPQVKGDIAFKNLSFAYGDEPTLSDINVTIPAGQKVAIVGPSGAGKSTLIQFLPRFFDPIEGEVTVDGVNIRDLKLEDLRDQIALVSQDPVLFAGNFAENIKMGKPHATDDEVIEAAKKAYIHDYISSLPEAYETQAGERGLNLSGGQKQRIALARAFLKRAPILIMDEATSALDTESEEKIQLALSGLFENVTGLMIAHRFSSIKFVDRILVLDKGRLVGDGTHTQLLSQNELYRKLYQNQIEA